MPMQIRLDAVASLFSEGVEDSETAQSAQAMAAFHARRAALLRESALQRLRRVVSTGLRAPQWAAIVPTCALLWQAQTTTAQHLPNPDTARTRPDGLAGLAPDLSAATLMAAYRHGLHARCLMGPATFWAPARRMVQHPANLVLRTALRNLLRRRDYDVTIDHDFDRLVAVCGGGSAHHLPLHPKIMQAHAALFDAGAAHGFEVWDRQGRLIGGGYGVAIGRAFVLERMFGTLPDAAGLGLAVMASHLVAFGFKMLDASFVSASVTGMGFGAQTRAVYNKNLDTYAAGGKPGRWRTDADIYAPRTQSTAVRRLFDAPAPRTAPDGEQVAATKAELFAALGLEVAATPKTAPKRDTRAA